MLFKYLIIYRDQKKRFLILHHLLFFRKYCVLQRPFWFAKFGIAVFSEPIVFPDIVSRPKPSFSQTTFWG